MKKKLYSEEIDLFSLIQFLWVNKLKIFLCVVIAVCITLYFDLSKKKQDDTYLATTKIFPITNLEYSRYKDYNNLASLYSINNVRTIEINAESPKKNELDLDIFKITRTLLLDLYMEKIAERDLLKKAIIKHELVKKENYKTEESFNEAVLRLASSIKIIEKINQNSYKMEGEENSILKHLQLSIVASINDKKKWESVLFYVDEHANRFVRDYIRIYFKNHISEIKQHYNYYLEDIETEILNAMENYTKLTRDRLAFLNEQAVIARHLNVATNTLDTQTFITDTGVVANLQTEMPYYMRGYEMIEKEIELIENRSEPEAFMPGLMSLENKKRRIIQSIKNLKRNETVFTKTPIVELDNFYAANLDIRTTTFIKQNKVQSLSTKLIISVLIGGILGIFFSLIWVNRRKFK
jgi:LPS O-antigen subunit length determinant protein (WzzB/FepE family)